MEQGDLAGALTQYGELAAQAEAAHDELSRLVGLCGQSIALAHQGEAAAARAAAQAALKGGAELGGRFAAFAHIAVGLAALAAGDRAAVHDAREASRQHMTVVSGGLVALQRLWNAESALSDRDLATARRWADEAVSNATGWHSTLALTARTRVAIAAGEPDQADRDAQDALTCAAGTTTHLQIPDILECLAALAGDAGSHREASRLFAAASSIRQRMGAVRFKIYDADCQASLAALRDTMGDKTFDSAWAEGTALSTEEAIAYAQRGRGRGQRKRPASGWASLTPTERDVVRLVSEGLANNAIAARLFISPRTVQTHLTHVYTKLGLISRVQLAQEANRHD
jgi:DNA-binding CsgD family transcriptional regulator